MPLYRFSVIIPVKNEGLNIKVTVDSILRTSGDVSYEIIVVDDNSSDNINNALNEYYSLLQKKKEKDS